MYHLGSLGYMLSAGLFRAAVWKSIYLIYDHLRQPSLRKKAFGMCARPTENKIDLYHTLRNRDHETKGRVIRLGNLLFNAASVSHLTYAIYGRLSHIIGSQISPLAASFPAGTMACIAEVYLESGP